MENNIEDILYEMQVLQLNLKDLSIESAMEDASQTSGTPPKTEHLPLDKPEKQIPDPNGNNQQNDSKKEPASDNQPISLLDSLAGNLKGFVDNAKQNIKDVSDMGNNIFDDPSSFVDDPVGSILKNDIYWAKKYYDTIYDQAQSVKNIAIKVVPAIRANPIFKDESSVKPSPESPYGKAQLPSIYLEKPSTAPEVDISQVFSALVQLRTTLLNKVATEIDQIQENEKARYDDLKTQLLSILPAEVRNKIGGIAVVKNSTAIANSPFGKVSSKDIDDLVKATKNKYLDDLEAEINSVEKDIADLIDSCLGTGNKTKNNNNSTNEPSVNSNPDQIHDSSKFTANSDGSTLSTLPTQLVDNIIPTSLVKMRETAIADLPPLSPTTKDNSADVTPSGIDGKPTAADLLEFINRLNQKTAIETLSNNVIIVDSNNRLFYQSLIKVISSIKSYLKNPDQFKA